MKLAPLVREPDGTAPLRVGTRTVNVRPRCCVTRIEVEHAGEVRTLTYKDIRQGLYRIDTTEALVDAVRFVFDWQD